MTTTSDRNQVIFRYGFLILAVLYLSVLSSGFEQMSFFMKPLLLLPLILMVYSSKVFTGKNLLMAALIFSWMGDTLLLFVYKSQMYFILGLLAFLIAHILYILLFRKMMDSAPKNSKKDMLVYAVVAIYGLTLMYILFPVLGEMRIPVIVYAFVICAMLVHAVWASRSMTEQTGKQLVTGAILFVISDSILALNKFYIPFSSASFLIMLSYLFAQYSIASACLKHAGQTDN